MQKVFLDTNIILDLIQKREGFELAAQILQGAVEGRYEVVTSTLSMVNVAYVLRKVFKGEALYQQLSHLRQYIGIVSVSATAHDKALISKGKDFEDAVQLFAAIESHSDCLVTRNGKDFSTGYLPILTPNDFLAIS